jgi:phosphoglycolate phosphatase-like HAD superfamily hydrolase
VRLVLWDIDGTLVHTAGHGRQAFTEAFERLFERPPGDGDVPMAGRTDYAIALDLLTRNGVPAPEELLPRMFEELHGALLRRRSLMAEQGHPQPGVREALALVGELPGCLQSLLTGNIRPNAHVKLAVFGLDGLVDLEIGGYGSHRGTRSELVAVARRKARAKHGLDVPAAETVVVGDTPLDVDAGRAAGARVVAVATGPYTQQELEQAEPDAVLPDLRDTGAVLEALRGFGASRPR